MNARSLSVAIGLACSFAAARAADVSFFGVLKAQLFEQTNQTKFISPPTNGFSFQAFAVPSGDNSLTSASVRIPVNPVKTNVLEPGLGGLGWGFSSNFNTQAALDAAYPYGNILQPANYRFRFQTANDGVHSVNINFSLLSVVGTPSVPRLTNFAEAQSIDQTLDFPLRWVITNGIVLDIVQVTIFDSTSNLVFATPPPFSAGALNGTSTSAIIPADSLPPGDELWLHLTVARPAGVETNSYPGAFGVAAVVRDTTVPLHTRPTPPAPLLSVLMPTNAVFRGRLTGEPQRRYHIEATADLAVWTNLLTTNAATSTFIFTDPEQKHRLYRARVGE